MPLPLTGPLKMSMVNDELRLTTRGKQNLGGTLTRSLARQAGIKSKISFSDLRGKSFLIAVTKTICTKTNWIVPAGVTNILSVSGVAGDGYPSTLRTIATHTMNWSHHYLSRDKSVVPDYYGTSSATYDGAYDRNKWSPNNQIVGTTVPGCNTEPLTTSTVYYQKTDCLTVTTGTRTTGSAAFRGTPTTAFGQTWLGNYTANPVESTVTNIPVTPGQTYVITPASGTCVTFIYEQPPKTDTFTANGTWVAPAGVTSISMVSGNGAQGGSGTSYTSRTQHRYVMAEYITHRVTDPPTYYSGKTVRNEVGGTERTWTEGSGVAKPSWVDNPTTCQPVNTEQWVNHATVYSSQICYEHTTSTVSVASGSYTTTGASATAFGKTFPGSTGPVVPVQTNFTNVTVVPGQSYPIVVPTGGTINITYTPTS